MALVFYLIAFLLALPLLKLLLQPRKRLPPSPWGLPLIGHLHLLSRNPHRSLQALSKKFGDLMFLRFGMVPVVVISSPAMAREVFKTHDVAFSDRPYILAAEFSTYNFRGMTFSSGEHWKKLRKISTTELFTTKRISSFTKLQLEEVSLAISSVIKSGKSVIKVREVVNTISLNMISQIIMSKRFFGEHLDDAAEAEVFKEVMNETLQLALQFHISEFIPKWLRWIDWSSRRRALQFFAKQDKFLQKIVDEHKSSQKTRSTPDFVDILLQMNEDEDVVKALLLEVITGGSDTSSCTVEWVMLALLNNPEIMVKLREELDAAVEPNQMVTESDFPKLPYLANVVKETLRLHSPGPLLVPRMTNQACVVDGYDIPQGATTFINYHAIVNDPRFWEKPERFWPERFEGSKLDVRGQDFELIPFGAGRRICPGLSLGLKNVYLMVGNLVHSFNWSCIPGRSYEMQEAFGIVSWPKTPLEAQISPRQAII